MALFEGLGIHTALHRSMSPQSWFWGNQEELLALIAELLDRQDLHFVAANSEKGKAPTRKPLQIKRPGEPKRKGTTLAEFAAMMKGL